MSKKKTLEENIEKTTIKENKNKTSKEELIGFHKGSLTTLSKERAELQRLLQIVEQLMKHHIIELKKLGVDITKKEK